MPSYRRRRGYGRRRGYRRRRLAPGRPYRGLYPRSKLVTLRYDGVIFASPTEGYPEPAVQILHKWNAGCAWDPDYASGDGTPTAGYPSKGYALHAHYYDRYCTLASKIKVRYWPVGSAGQVANIAPSYLMLKLDDDGQFFEQKAGVPGTQDHRYWRTTPNLKYKLISGTTQVGHIWEMTMSYSARKYLGIKDPVDSDALNPGVRTHPSETAYFTLACAPLDTRSPLPLGAVSVTIDYLVLFTSPRDDVDWAGYPGETPLPPGQDEQLEPEFEYPDPVVPPEPPTPPAP